MTQRDPPTIHDLLFLLIAKLRLDPQTKPCLQRIVNEERYDELTECARRALKQCFRHAYNVLKTCVLEHVECRERDEQKITGKARGPPYNPAPGESS